MTLVVPPTDAQVSFSASLAKMRSEFLQQALSQTISKLVVSNIDHELAKHVPAHSLSALASHGLRGEMVFPVPSVLRANPRLLGYYRLLLGFSQKEFYTSKSGLGTFKAMEERGLIRPALSGRVPELCDALCSAAGTLVAALGTTTITAALLDDLTLLTLGPQLRGGANVRKGIAGIRVVFNAIQDVVVNAVQEARPTSLRLKNSANRIVRIEFAPDPDIVVREEMNSGQERLVLAVEVKAGADFSNIHNRLGEAEKSHQKAKLRGFTEFWTIVNVEQFDVAGAKKESPTTTRFYHISDLIAAAGPEYDDFRNRIVSLTNIV